MSRRRLVYDRDGNEIGYATTEVGQGYVEMVLPKEILPELYALLDARRANKKTTEPWP